MKIINCIFCEDVRAEVGGKSSLMGVHGNTIVLQVHKDNRDKLTIRLGVFITMTFDDTKHDNDITHIKFNLNNGETSLAIGDGPLPSPEERVGKQLTLTAVSSQFPVDIDHELNVVIDLFDNKHELIKSVPTDTPAKFTIQPIEK